MSSSTAGVPNPGLQTSTGSRPDGNQVTQVADECAKFHLHVHGSQVAHTKSSASPCHQHQHIAAASPWSQKRWGPPFYCLQPWGLLNGFPCCASEVGFFALCQHEQCCLIHCYNLNCFRFSNNSGLLMVILVSCDGEAWYQEKTILWFMVTI